MAEFSNDTDFANLETYVPTFYIKPFRTGHPEHHDVIRSSTHPPYNSNTSFLEEHTPILEWYIRPTQITQSPSYDDLVNKLVVDHGWNIQDFDILKDRAGLWMRNNRQVYDTPQVYQKPLTTSNKAGFPFHETEENRPLGIPLSPILETKEAVHNDYLEGRDAFHTDFKKHLSETQVLRKSNIYNRNVNWSDVVLLDKKNQVVSGSFSKNVKVQQIEKVMKEKMNENVSNRYQDDKQRSNSFSNNTETKVEEDYNSKSSQKSLIYRTSGNNYESLKINFVDPTDDVNDDIRHNHNKSNHYNTNSCAHKNKAPQPLETQPLEMKLSNPPEQIRRFKELEYNNKAVVNNIVPKFIDSDKNSTKTTNVKETCLDRHVSKGFTSTFAQLQNAHNDCSTALNSKEHFIDPIKHSSVNVQSLISKIIKTVQTKGQGLETNESELFTNANAVKNKLPNTEECTISTNLQHRSQGEKNINLVNDNLQTVPKTIKKIYSSIIQVQEIMKIFTSPKSSSTSEISDSHNTLSQLKIENYTTNALTDYKPLVKHKTLKNDKILKLQRMIFDSIRQAFFELTGNDQNISKTNPEVLSTDSSQSIIKLHEVEAFKQTEEHSNAITSYLKTEIEQTESETSNTDGEFIEPLTVEDSLVSNYDILSKKISTQLNTLNIDKGDEVRHIESLNLDYNVFVDDIQNKRLEDWALKYNLYPEIFKYLNRIEPITSKNIQETKHAQRSLSSKRYSFDSAYDLKSLIKSPRGSYLNYFHKTNKEGFSNKLQRLSTKDVIPQSEQYASSHYISLSDVPQVKDTRVSQTKPPVEHRAGYLSRKNYTLKNAYSRRLSFDQRLKLVRDIYLRTYKNVTIQN